MDMVLRETLQRHVDQLLDRYPMLVSCREELNAGYLMLEACYERGNKLLIAGNGGSAADAEHMSAELMKSFKLKRPLTKDITEAMIKIDAVRGKYLVQNLEMPLPAIPLVAHEAQVTAFMNDVDAAGVFAQQLFGYGRRRCLSGNFHFRKFRKYSIRRSDSKSNGTSGARTVWRRWRQADADGGQVHQSAGEGDI